jgi:hypothetical protein
MRREGLRGQGLFPQFTAISSANQAEVNPQTHAGLAYEEAQAASPARELVP